MVIDRLAKDLRLEFQDMQGLSRRNLLCMQAFAKAYPNPEFVQHVVAQWPWDHNIVLLTKPKDTHEREWDAHAQQQHGLNRPPFKAQIP